MKVCLQCKKQFEQNNWKCPQCGHEPSLHNGYFCFAPELAFENSGFDENFHTKLARLEQRCFWFRGRNEMLMLVMNIFFPEAQSLLEIGCGTGFVLRRFAESYPKLRLVGGEIYVSALEFVSQKAPHTELIQVDACNLPFKNEFDVIGAFDVLEHIDDDEQVIKQMYQATKHGGGAIITVPQHPWLWSAQDEMAFHKRRYTRKELIKKVKDVGFQIVFVTSFVSFLLPLMLLSRMKRQLSSDKFDPLVELKIGRITNAMLENILTVERLLIKCGFSFPAGGSLLIVAKQNQR